MASPEQLQAATFTGPLLGAIERVGGPRSAMRGHLHLHGVYDPSWLATLPLPIGENRPPEQAVTLMGAAGHERYCNEEDLIAAYARRPRTKAYEQINKTKPDAWYARVAKYLGILARSELPVLCSVFESTPRDETIGPHYDTWFGANVQFGGDKVWTVGDGLTDSTQQPTMVVMRPGDVLIVPKYLPHDVETPQDPGYSDHLSFAICRDPTVPGNELR